jgi:hypothetical protein
LIDFMRLGWIAIMASGLATAACPTQSVQPEFEPFCRILETNPTSSLAHFRIAELLFQRNDLQDALNSFRSALDGDLQPKWIEVWSHINMGKIFDGIGGTSRRRALDQYRQALRTGDNTFGVLDEVSTRLKEMGVDVLLSARRVDSRSRVESVEKIPADYSEEAKIAELEGTVLLEGLIGKDGIAHDLSVLRPLGLGLDEKAIDSVRQWLFMPGRTAERSVIAVDFLLSSKLSRWHLVRVEFSPPAGGVRPAFLSAPYPGGTGVLGNAAIEEGQLLGAMGRQATATVSFDVNELGVPVNIQARASSETTWGAEAAALLSEWRFKPGMKDGQPVSVPCSIDLMWGPRNLTARMVDAFRNAAAEQELKREIDKAFQGAN